MGRSPLRLHEVPASDPVPPVQPPPSPVPSDDPDDPSFPGAPVKEPPGDQPPLRM